MKAALATSHGRMAPCFGGVELQIVDDNADLREARVLSTHGWHPLAWGRELMRRDVTLLMCAGIDQATWAAVQGHGIQVIPNAIGDPAAVFATWRSGRLSPPRLWPAYPVGFGGLGAGWGGNRGAPYAAPAYPRAGAVAPYAAPYGAGPTREQEADMPKGQAEYFEDALEGIKKRIAELETGSEERE